MKHIGDIKNLINAADAIMPSERNQKTRQFLASATQNISYYIIAILSGIFYLLFVSDSFVGAFSLAMIFSLLFEYLWPRFKTILNYRYFRDRNTYQVAARDSTRAMILITDLDRIIRIVCRIIYNKIRIKGVAVLLYDDKNKCYNTICSEGTYKNRSGICLPEYNIAENVSANTCIPCISKGNIVALIIADKKINGKSLSRSEINLVSMLASQGAVAIENSFYFNKLREKTEQLKSIFFAENI